MRLFDAHNHLFDDRLSPFRAQIICDSEWLPSAAVVNGSCETDWPQVLDLAKEYPWIIPSFGYHPWYVSEATPNWERTLLSFLDAVPSAIGEIGLDHWIERRDDALQERLFIRQLEIAAERKVPATIHCLRAFGRLLELLKTGPHLDTGFLLHSYGGSGEMVPAFVDLGAYFSFPGFFLGPGKEKKQNVFRVIPADRLLVETDAPDQCLPEALEQFRLAPGSDGKRINDPRNLGRVYDGLAALLGYELEDFATRVEENFQRLFGGVLR